VYYSLSLSLVLKQHHGHLSRLQSRQQVHRITSVDRMHDEDVWPYSIPKTGCCNSNSSRCCICSKATRESDPVLQHRQKTMLKMLRSYAPDRCQELCSTRAKSSAATLQWLPSRLQRLRPPCQAPKAVSTVPGSKKGCVLRSKGCQVGHNGCVHCSANADIQLQHLRHDYCCIGVVTEVHTATLHGM